MSRIGIMGGTFDPIHIGHLAAAEQVRCAYELDEVLFIPTNIQPDKVERKVAQASDRLTMAQLAVDSNAHFSVSDIEIARGGRTYTVDTLRQLREMYGEEHDLYFITGADAVLSIIKWRESAAIATLAKIVAVTRPGYEVTEEAKASIVAFAPFDISYFQMTALSVSSSMLREWIAAGKSVRYLVPDPVRAYIEEKGLYQ